MKKIILILSFCINSLLLGQTDQKSIELPDFVITGRQSVEVPIAQKKKPELISTLSQDFFTPQYSPEELPLLISSLPVPIRPSITLPDDFYSGSLQIGAGLHTLPIGEFHLSKSFDNYLIGTKVWGLNISEYINNAGYNTSGVSLENNFFISTKSDFLPGTNIRLFGEYSRDSYKFYASSNPTFKRETNKGITSLSIMNKYSRWFDFGLNLNAGFLKLKENNLAEKKLKADVFVEMKLSKITFGLYGFYQKQLIDNNLSKKNNYDFYFVEGYINTFLSQFISLDIGAIYSRNSNDSFFSPFGSFQLKIDKDFVFHIDFKPNVSNYIISDFLSNNTYMVNGLIDNVFSRDKVNLKTILKYEYQKYFSISFWGQYSQTKNYLYFEDISQRGFFDVKIAAVTRSFAGGFDLLFHPGTLGYFIGEAKYQRIIDVNDKFIPYAPKLSASLIYGYDFSFGVGIKSKYRMAHDIFTDLANTNKLKSYHNLSVSIYYKLFDSLSLTADFQNILNRSNVVLSQYEEKPFDVILGVEYRW